MIEEAERAFWWFVCERQGIWHRRFVKEEDGPWTEDPILRDCHFTNVYRELDRGTMWFHRQLTARRLTPENPPALLWNSVVYRLVNRLETFEAFGGIPTSAQRDEWLDFLTEAKGRGEKVFTGRHQVRGLADYGKTVEWMAGNCVPVCRQLLAAKTVQGAITALKTIPGVGAFFANQIYLDLLEAGFFPRFCGDDYIELGPGAKAGLNIIFGRSSQVLMRELRFRKSESFTDLGLDIKILGGHEITIKNIEQ